MTIKESTELKEYMERIEDKIDKKLSELTAVVNPLVTEMALLKQDHKNSIATRVYWSIISALITLIMTLKIADFTRETPTQPKENTEQTIKKINNN